VKAKNFFDIPLLDDGIKNDSGMKPIVITGGTGLVGSRLSELLAAKGYEVRHLSRQGNPTARFKTYSWDIKSGTIDVAAFEGVETIIHLAGAGIAEKRWSAARKRELVDSRAGSGDVLKKVLAEHHIPIKTLIAASAAGFYGDTGSQSVDEDSPAGTTFLAEICKKWEASSLSLGNSLGARTVLLRIGVVLTTKGSALKELLPKASFLPVFPYFGDGKMLVAWIHIDDLCRMFIEAIENPVWNGIYNAVTPQPLSSAEMATAVGAAWSKGGFHTTVPAPPFVLRIVMGEMADIVLHSSCVLPKRTATTNFAYQFTDMKTAVEDLLARKI
jgi:hypothetical protein